MWRSALIAVALGAGCDELDLGGCVEEGDGYDLKVEPGGPCCDGLTPADTTEEPDADGVCQVEHLNPAKVCIACGDGACGTAENACNCAEDCASGG